MRVPQVCVTWANHLPCLKVSFKCFIPRLGEADLLYRGVVGLPSMRRVPVQQPPTCCSTEAEKLTGTDSEAGQPAGNLLQALEGCSATGPGLFSLYFSLSVD